MTKTMFAAALLASATMPVVAFAAEDQAAPQDSATATTDGVQDIVVTAQRVSSSIQRTPISIQAYSGDELQKRAVSNIADLVRTDSSVNINLSTGMPIIAIRGVSSQNATEVGDPAVSVATDGVFTNRPYGTFGGLYDVERVEILRGPQGTLFGRNSTGGTINVITARPSDENEARVTAEVGNYNLFGAEGFANVALGGGFSARMSFDVRSRDGYRNNGIVKGDDEDLKSGRLQLAYKSDNGFSAWVLAQYTAQGGVGSVSEILPFTYKNGTGGEPVHQIPANISNGKDFTLYAPYFRDLKHWEVRGGLTYELANGISFNYLGGYDSIRYTRQQAINPYAFSATPTPFIYHNRETPDTVNQEIRIASDPKAQFRWQVGAYLFNESSTVLAYTETNPNSTSAFKLIEFNYPKIKANSKAVFAQASYSVDDKLTLTAGGRYTWDKKSRDGTFSLLFIPLVIPQPASTDSHKPTWTLGVDYQVTPRNLLYAKVSTGYKVGGFNDSVSNYGPETVTAYEIGSKNSFLGNHLQLNVAGFRMDYKDQQVTQFLAGVASSGSATFNAGASRIWGAELNLVAQSRELGRLTVSGNYTHARYLDFTSSPGWDVTQDTGYDPTKPANLDFSGNRLPLSPDWSFSGQYERPIELGSFTVTPRAAVKYQSTQYFAPNNYANQKQAGYALVDLGLELAPASGAWSVQAYVKNLTDKTVFADASEFYTFNNYTYTYQPPRTYGVRFSASFK